MNSAGGDDGIALSVVIPTFNEEANVRQIGAAVVAELEATGESFDLIFIDNASTDRTVALVREMCAEDPRIRLIVNARNFGQMRSPTHGIFQARGRAIIGMCADFQDPPALIPAFVERWKAGADIVLGVRRTENASRLLSTGRALAYGFVSAWGDYKIVPNATGFGLYDRKVVDTIAKLNEPEPFFRGLLVETGYTIDMVPYERPKRVAGLSKNSFFVLLDFALSGIAASSKRLVRVPFTIGVMTAIAFAFTLPAGLLLALFGVPGASWWLLAALVEFNFALLFLFLGIIGDQVRLIAERTRQAPLVIERARVNFPPGY